MSIETLPTAPRKAFVTDEQVVEVLRGVELPKPSPKSRHLVLQLEIGEALRAWAEDEGEVSSGWRFRLSRGSGADDTTLVPDVAFVSADRMAAYADSAGSEATFAPDVAVEIRSPGDRERNVRTKVQLYLAGGARLVLDVDPLHRRIVASDRAGERVFEDGSTFKHPEVPKLALVVRDLFDSADHPY